MDAFAILGFDTPDGQTSLGTLCAFQTSLDV